MLPYWILFCAVLMAALSPMSVRPSQRGPVWIAVILVVSLFVGFRHEVGGDWFNYARQFEHVAAMSFSDALRTTKDVGYYPLGWIIARAGGDIYVLNFCCALLLLSGTVSLARRQPRPALALLAALPYLIFVVGMGYTRQSAAIGCAMLGLVALGKQGRLTFVAWVLAGSAFHKTAVLLLPVAGLARSSNRAWTVLWVVFASLAGYWLFVHDASETLWQNYVEADYAFASEGAGIRVAMNAVPALILLCWRSRIVPDPSERSLWTWMAVFALACIPLLWVSPTAIDRLALYFIPLQLFVFGRIGLLSNSLRIRTLLVLGLCFYFAAVQFVWLNFAKNAQSWLPYQSGLFQF